MITAIVRYKLPPHIDYAACREHFHKIAPGFREAKGLISKHFIWKTVGEIREASDATLLGLPDLGAGSVTTIPHWGVGAFARRPPWQLESAMHMATTLGHGGKVYEVPSELMFLKSPSGPSRRRLRHHRPVLGCYR